MEDYFGKFKDLKYQRCKELGIEPPKNILWIDEDMIENHTLGNSMRRALRAMGAIPDDIKITYCSQEKALDELLENEYALVILDNDAYKGTPQGATTLADIRNADKGIPVIYTTASPNQLKNNYVKENTNEVICTMDIPKRFFEFIQKYIRGDGGEKDGRRKE